KLPPRSIGACPVGSGRGARNRAWPVAKLRSSPARGRWVFRSKSEVSGDLAMGLVSPLTAGRVIEAFQRKRQAGCIGVTHAQQGDLGHGLPLLGMQGQAFKAFDPYLIAACQGRIMQLDGQA